MEKATQKTIVLHLEGAEPTLIEKWCTEGHLPTLNKLRQRGVYARLLPPKYIDSGGVWPTFSTGTNPGKHGIGFYPRQIKNGTYQIIKKYATDMCGEHFWDTISRQGYLPLVMDMALTYPKTDTKGILICNWGDEHASHPPSSYPSKLIHQILKDFGQNELNDWHQHRLSNKDEWKNFRDTTIKAIELRTKVLTHLLQKNAWNLAVLNFGEIHWASHIAWHLHDETHPEYDEEIANYCGNIILKSYQALDKSVAEILKVIPNKTSILIASAVGMGTQIGGELLVNDILQRLDLRPAPIKSNSNTFDKIKEKILPGKLGMSYAIQQTERIISPKTMMRAKALIPVKFWDKWTRRFLDLGNNRAQSLAFQVPGDHAGLIRINLKGREPNGKVSKGKEYDELCFFITTAFLELRDSEDGSPIVKEVIKIRDFISGDLVDDQPDLAIIWRDGKPIQTIESERIGKLTIKEFHKRSGGHINRGFLIAKGPHFKENTILDGKDLFDIAPTVLSLFNSPIPKIMDGKVIEELFK